MILLSIWETASHIGVKLWLLVLQNLKFCYWWNAGVKMFLIGHNQIAQFNLCWWSTGFSVCIIWILYGKGVTVYDALQSYASHTHLGWPSSSWHCWFFFDTFSMFAPVLTEHSLPMGGRLQTEAWCQKHWSKWWIIDSEGSFLTPKC